MGAPILVTGGTGTLGRHVVSRLGDAGRQLRVLSRHHQENTAGVEYLTGDLADGRGVDAAVAGVEVVVHLAGTAKGDDEKAANLVRYALPAGVKHLLFVSVVGADRVRVDSFVDRAMFGYFAAKLAAERSIAESGVAWTTLRATQFYDTMLETIKQMTKMPVVPVPSGTRFQPVSTGEVAERIAYLALGEPSGLVAEMAGPRAYLFSDLIRSYLQASGKHRAILPIRFPGSAARSIRQGANLALEEGSAGSLTWEAFLECRGGP